jgi:hypothetical protein
MKKISVFKFLIIQLAILITHFNRTESIKCTKSKLPKEYAVIGERIKLHQDEDIGLPISFLLTLKEDSCFIHHRKDLKTTNISNLKFLEKFSTEYLKLLATQNSALRLSPNKKTNFFVMFYNKRENAYYFYEPSQEFSCQNLKCSQSIFLPQNLTIDTYPSQMANKQKNLCFFVSESQNLTFDSETDTNLTSYDSLITHFCVGPNVNMTLKINLRNENQNFSEILNIHGQDSNDNKGQSKLKLFLDTGEAQESEDFELNINCKKNLEINFENIIELKTNMSVLANSRVKLSKCILTVDLLEEFDASVEAFNQSNFSNLSNNEKLNLKDFSLLSNFFCYFNSCYSDKVNDYLPYLYIQTNLSNMSEMCSSYLNIPCIKLENNQTSKEIKTSTLTNYENQQEHSRVEDIQSSKLEYVQTKTLSNGANFSLVFYQYSFLVYLLIQLVAS